MKNVINRFKGLSKKKKAMLTSLLVLLFVSVTTVTVYAGVTGGGDIDISNGASEVSKDEASLGEELTSSGSTATPKPGTNSSSGGTTATPKPTATQKPSTGTSSTPKPTATQKPSTGSTSSTPKPTATQKPSTGGTSSTPKPSTNTSNGKPASTPKPVATQKPNANAGKVWKEAEYKTIDHPAETQEVWVVDVPASSYDEPIYTGEWRTICNCGADITGNLSSHAENHALAGEKASYGNFWIETQIGANTITVPEQGHYETKTIKEAWQEKVLVREAGWY